MASTASLHKNRKSTLARIQRFLAKDDSFSTSNNQIIMRSHDSLHSRIYSAHEPVVVQPINSKDDILKATVDPEGSWQPIKVGDEFGPTWSHHIFKISVSIPSEWTGKEVHLRWNSSSEAMLLHDLFNRVIQGFVPKHRESYTISKKWSPNENGGTLVYYILMSCNGLFGALGEGFSIDPPNPNLKYKLKMAEVAVFEPLLFKLYTDLEILSGVAKEMPDDIRGFQALYAANEMINLIIQENYEKASAIADKFFSEGNGEKAHTLSAMGHCHIDTAWLWTYDETKQKCARSWSSQIELLKEYPDIVFTCSQVQQLAWMKETYPTLFEDIKKYVALKRFIPVGGTWVEMDGLLPDGESMIRQFLYGQDFLRKEFGLEAKEFWLPDTFGYSGQIPQIMKHVGLKRFLTQKLSWNRVNKFPHHSFIWEGIDGSSVLAHFPPGDSYEMNGFVKELLKSVNNSEDKGRTNIGAYLYGLGDGGGGPTISIVERLKRVQNVDGLPKVVFEGPDNFFSKLEKDSNKLCRWVGELYLEMHNGTYTSQANIKAFNRKLEILLKRTELLLVIYLTHRGARIGDEDIQVLENCWKDLLLNQFHDVIPGSCIELVVQDALKIYKSILQRLVVISDKYSLLQRRDMGSADLKSEHPKFTCFNSLPWPIKSVFMVPLKAQAVAPTEAKTYFQTGITLPILSPYLEIENELQYTACVLKLSPSGYSQPSPIPLDQCSNTVTFTKTGSVGVFDNGMIHLEFSLRGPPKETLHFRSNGERSNGREWKVFEDFRNTGTEAGMFYVYDDNPVCWDAWDCDDFHLETRKSLLDFVDESSLENSIQVISAGPLVASYKWTVKASLGKDSPLSITRYTIVKAASPLVEYITKVDWSRQSHKFLKVEFPANVLARNATYEIQYGHLKRPTDSNTSWNAAQVETSGHKWVDLSQYDYGVSVINDSKYGFRIKDNVISLSLLRSPKAPDPNCDMHEHLIRYAILPHANSFQEAGTIRQAYEFNYMAHGGIDVCDMSNDSDQPNHFVVTSEESVIPEVVKPGHENPNGSICLRLYESFGGSASPVTITLRCDVKKIVECDGLERPLPNCKPLAMKKEKENGQVVFSRFRTDFRPFQIKSFLITL